MVIDSPASMVIPGVMESAIAATPLLDLGVKARLL